MTSVDKNKSSLRITILVDTPDSWIVPYAHRLQDKLKQVGHKVFYCQDSKQIRRGDLAFFLGCGKIVPPQILRRNRHNLVIHPSALPQGKGFAPLAWQIIEGKNKILITLFEAVEEVDTGPIYFQDMMVFEGHELNTELRREQGKKTIKLVLEFVNNYPNIKGKPQTGQSTWYRRRMAKHSELDVTKSIAEQFNLLRTVDNKCYPAFFVYRGHTYILKIYHAK